MEEKESGSLKAGDYKFGIIFYGKDGEPSFYSSEGKTTKIEKRIKPPMKKYEIWIGSYHLGQGYDPPSEPQKIAVKIKKKYSAKWCRPFNANHATDENITDWLK